MAIPVSPSRLEAKGSEGKQVLEWRRRRKGEERGGSGGSVPEASVWGASSCQARQWHAGTSSNNTLMLPPRCPCWCSHHPIVQIFVTRVPRRRRSSGAL